MIVNSVYYSITADDKNHAHNHSPEKLEFI